MTGTHLVVVGDTLLDRDIDGTVSRLCPDAPAPVLEEAGASRRPGGAGLAALLAAGTGVSVSLVTALADDTGGADLTRLLAGAGVRVHRLPLAGATPEKIRLRADGRLLLRLDRGGPPTNPAEPDDGVLALLAEADAILVSDYGRGVAELPGLRTALRRSRVPVVWDPHPRGPAPVPGIRLATPNEAEARVLAGLPAGAERLGGAAWSARRLRRRWQAGAVAVTLGAEGALLCHTGATPLVVPAPSRGEGDTCGAGDRFAVAASLALAGGALVSEAVQQAVAAAADFVARGGVGGAIGRAAATGAPTSTVTPAGTGPVRVRSGTDQAGGAGAGGGSGGGAGGDGGAGAGGGRAGGDRMGHGTGRVRVDAATASRLDRVLPADITPAAVGGARQTGGGTGVAGPVPEPADPDPQLIGAAAAGRVVAAVRAGGGVVVAAGGCFDLLHAGHVATLRAARGLGDCLIVCVNSDPSVRALKGPDRPLVGQQQRATVLAALACVDAVVIFDEPTPHAVLSWLRPDVWVKGGDYGSGDGDGPDLPEARLLRRWGGQAVVVPYLDGHSTTDLIAAARRAEQRPVGAR